MRTSQANLVFTVRDERLKKDVASASVKRSHVMGNHKIDLVATTVKRALEDLVVAYGWDGEVESVEVLLKRYPKTVSGISKSDQALREARGLVEDGEKGGD
jgi:hypothetical protein